jgi:GH35 family endo-1,4-beta-xylanase
MKKKSRKQKKLRTPAYKNPEAELYYNDCSLENEAKRNGAVELIQRLKRSGVPISAVGLQMS